jgi:nicotinamide-nucleotide adenylyltransferase
MTSLYDAIQALRRRNNIKQQDASMTIELPKLGRWRKDFLYEMESLAPTWQERIWRYENARRILDSPVRMAEYWHRAHSLDAAQEPTGRITNRRKKSSNKALMRGLRAVKHVVLMPGSFNPITIAHQALSHFENLRRSGEAPFPEGPWLVIWSCAISTINKEGVERASLVDRLAQLAIFGDHEHPFPPMIMLFNRGLFLDQIRALRAMLHPEATIRAIVGFDKIVQIFDPRYYEDRDAALQELFAAARFLVAPRDGAGIGELAELLARSENWPYAERVRPTHIPARFNELSSTRLRALAATEPDSAELRWNVPPEAYALIRETGAYVQYQDGAPDLYALRQQWLQTIAGLPVYARRALPPISDLVRRASTQDADGAAIQAALADGHWADDPERAFDELRSLGLFRRRTSQDSGG